MHRVGMTRYRACIGRILPGMTPLRRLSDYVFRYRQRFALGLLCVVLTQAVTLTAPWVQKYAIDDLTTGVTARKLLVYGILLLAIAIVGGIFRFLMRRL